MNWFVYMLKCRNGDLYTGVTNDLARRTLEHQQGIGGKFTRSNPPVGMVYHEEHPTKEDALRREAQIKTWSRSKKLALIAGDRQALKAA